MMVLGTFAYCGSGQDTLADGFCKYLGYVKYGLGDVVRGIAKERKLPLYREVLQSIRKEYDFKYGREYIPNLIVKEIAQRRDDKIIITGIRTIEEYEIFKRELGMLLIYVSADKNIRYERMLRRSDEKDATTIEELEKQMKNEDKLFDYKILENFKDYEFRFDILLSDYLKLEKKIVTDLEDEMQRIVDYEKTY